MMNVLKTKQTLYLDNIWQEHGKATAVLESGIHLFHAGLVRDVDGFDDARVTWFALGPEAKEYALSYVNTGYKGRQTFLLVCRTRKPLKCADFGSTSFTELTKKYCENQHPRMARALFKWGISKQGLDGICFDYEFPEVLFFRPSSANLSQVSCDLTAKVK